MNRKIRAAETVSSFGLFFNSEGGGYMFLRNVRLCPDYKALQLRDRMLFYDFLINLTQTSR
jgi:hypothetical protein